MTKPLVFISHKHADSSIAAAVADFITARSLNKVDVFTSSKWNFNGPRFGAGLNSALKQALWRTDVLILIYTSADQDWSFCMWECGSATHPQSPDTNVIVFQCGVDVPTPFASDMRVNVRTFEDALRFTKEFLTTPSFFPSLGEAVAPDYPQAAIEAAAHELFDKITKVLPVVAQDEEWPAWPFMRIELPSRQVEQLEVAIAAERVNLSHDIVKQHAVVIKSDVRTAQLFALASLPQKQMFKALLDKWQDAYPTSDPTWFDSCCEQIMVSARRGIPVIQWTPLREVGGETEFTPVLSRVKRLPFAGSVQFDIFFYNLSDPQAVPVVSKMIPISRFFHKNLGHTKPEEIWLRELVAELERLRCDRVAILDAETHPLYVIHRGMIHKFIADKILDENSQAVSPYAFTLADLLAQKEMEKAGENFVVIKKKATLAEARSSMSTRPDCRDVFVTEEGTWEEPVLGWLTDIDIAQTV